MESSENKIWMPESEIKKWEKWHSDIFRQVFLMTDEQREVSRERSIRNKDNRKWAWIKVGNTRKLCFVDNKTMKAFKADGYNKTWIEIKKYSFERWATSFDL